MTTKTARIRIYDDCTGKGFDVFDTETSLPISGLKNLARIKATLYMALHPSSVIAVVLVVNGRHIMVFDRDRHGISSETCFGGAS